MNSQLIKSEANKKMDEYVFDNNQMSEKISKDLFSLYLSCLPLVRELSTEQISCPECPYQHFRRNPRAYSKFK